MTGTYTYTRTSVRYSTDSEIGVTRLLLHNFGVPERLTNSGNFISGITELAGIGRMQLNNTENMPEHAHMVNAHYDDAADLLDSIRVSRALFSRRIAWGVVHALADVIPASAEGTTVQETIRTLMRKLRDNGIKIGDQADLNTESAFALGVSAHLVGGDKKDRNNWWDRENVDRRDLLARRNFHSEDIPALHSFHDEIVRPPVSGLEAPASPKG